MTYVNIRQKDHRAGWSEARHCLYRLRYDKFTIIRA